MSTVYGVSEPRSPQPNSSHLHLLEEAVQVPLLARQSMSHSMMTGFKMLLCKVQQLSHHFAKNSAPTSTQEMSLSLTFTVSPKEKNGNSKPTSQISLMKHVQSESISVIFTGSQPYDFLTGI